MSCQIEAYKNEVEIMKTDQNKYSEEKETQIKALQHALVGMQQVCGVPQGMTLGPHEFRRRNCVNVAWRKKHEMIGRISCLHTHYD